MNVLEKKQQVIREGLAQSIAGTFDRNYEYLKPRASNLFDEYTQHDFLRMADRHLAFLAEQGVVITLTHVDWTEKDFPHTGLALTTSLTKEDSLAVHTTRKTPRTIPPD